MKPGDRRPRHRRPEHGFTLLEMVVAFTIAAASLVALLNAIGTGLAVVDRTRARDELVAVATSTLARVGGDLPIELGIQNGMTGDISWQVDIARYASGPTRPARYRLFSVTVEARDAAGHRQTLRTLRPAGPS